MMKLKCSIIRVSPQDPDIKGTLISISQGWGAVWIGNRVHEYPLSRILIEDKIELPINIDEEIKIQNASIEKIDNFIKENRPVIKPTLTSKLKGTE